MELKPSTPPGPELGGHASLRPDLWRAYAGIFSGSVTGLMLQLLLRLGDVVSFAIALVAGPVFFSAMFMLLRRGHRNRRIVRLVGAIAGWIAFLSTLADPGSQQWLFVFLRIAPGLGIVVIAAVALALVTAGFVAADWAWRAIFLRSDQQPL